MIEFANIAFIRIVWLSILILMLVWVLKYLGGVATSPDDLPGGANNTSSLFNWHPIMMVLAFPVIMTEAVITHSGFPINLLPRFVKKTIHGSLHLISLVLMVLGLVAVFRSHTQKEPKAIDDIYSMHSYLGITTMVLLTLQVSGGAVLYVFPVLNEETKKQYSKYHAFAGLTAYFCALGTMLAGIQEKQTFSRHDSLHIDFDGSYQPLMTIPASLGPLIIILAVVVAFHVVFLKTEVKTASAYEAAPAEEALVEA